MPIYKEGKGKWRVRIWHQGQKTDAIIEGRKSDAKDYETRERARIKAAGVVKTRVAPKFSDFSLGAYRLHAEMHLGKTTWSNRRYDIATLIEHFGSTRLSDITTDRVEQYKQWRHREGKAPRTINNELMALRAMLTYARELGVPAATPRIKKLPVRQGRHSEAWTADEMADLYAACRKHEPDILPLVVFLTNTGCRKVEAMALRWDHVDLERRMLRIWPYDDKLGDFDTKSKKPREVPIGKALLPWLSGPRLSDVWVFPVPRSTRGKRPKPRRYAHFPKREFGRALTKAGLTGGPHRLRHTFATHFLAARPDLHVLGKVMGHGDAKVTALYSHLLPDHLERARDAVELMPDVGAAAFVAERRWAGAAQNRPSDRPGR